MIKVLNNLKNSPTSELIFFLYKEKEKKLNIFENHALAYKIILVLHNA